MKNSSQMLLPLAIVALIVMFTCKYVPQKKEKYCGSCMMK